MDNTHYKILFSPLTWGDKDKQNCSLGHVCNKDCWYGPCTHIIIPYLCQMVYLLHYNYICNQASPFQTPKTSKITLKQEKRPNKQPNHPHKNLFFKDMVHMLNHASLHLGPPTFGEGFHDTWLNYVWLVILKSTNLCATTQSTFEFWSLFSKSFHGFKTPALVPHPQILNFVAPTFKYIWGYNSIRQHQSLWY